ncbi:MAG: hypothetical protein AB7E73_13445, partial [Burkholderiales bacterium]
MPVVVPGLVLPFAFPGIGSALRATLLGACLHLPAFLGILRTPLLALRRTLPAAFFGIGLAAFTALFGA